MQALRNRLEHYADVSDDIWETFTAGASEKAAFSKDESLIREGEKTPHVLIVEDGWAVRHRSLDDGRRQICNVMVIGDIFDLQALYDLKADHSVTAITDMTVRIYDAEAFADKLRQSKEITRLFWWAAVQEESILREQILRVGRRSARERIGHFLLELQRRMGIATDEQPEIFDLPLTRVDLADSLGLTPVHVSRTMSALRRSDLIEETSGAIKVIDRPALVRLAQFDSDYLHIKRMKW